MSSLDYSDVISRITEYYDVSSADAWNIVNQYDLTPAQAASLIPEYQQYVYYGNSVNEVADGIYKLYNNAGDVIGYNQVATVSMGNMPSVTQALNSNTQTGVAEYAVKTKFAGNSVIDQNGKLKLSGGVSQYNGGSLIGSVLATEVSPAAIIPAISVAASLGKGIDSLLYNAAPTFWDSLGLSSLNPQTWNSIICDSDDATGITAASKAAVKMLLKLDDSGSTKNAQAYVSQDAYNYMALALAKASMFAPGTYTPLPVTKNQVITITNKGDPIQCIYDAAARMNLPSSRVDQYLSQYLANPNTNKTNTVGCAIGDQSNYYGRFMTVYFIDDSALPVGASKTINANGYCNNARATVTPNTIIIGTSAGSASGSTQSVPLIAGIYDSGNGRYLVGNSYGTISSALPGTYDQPGAAVPQLSPNATAQEVADYISQHYPDLYDNRIEQSVVQDDGTTKTIVYYPVPMPNDTTDTTIDSEKSVTTDQPVTVVLPEGTVITLPDGTTVTSDGETPIELPPGQYILPAGTTITNNYIYNTTNITGGSQADTEVTDNSTDELKNLIVSLITQLKTSTLEDTEAQEITDTTDPNPTDTGDGTTPPVVVPTGTASNLWSVYNPTLAEINNFGSWLWSNNFVDQLLKLFNDPMQAIIGLHKTFIPPITGARQNIQVGYLDSGVSSLTVPTQYSTVDCGSIQLPEYFGNVFDYSPYTRVFIYLPFIGFKELDVSQVMRSSIGVKYHGDAYTGTGLAEISVTRDGGAGGVLYTFACECAVRYPLSQGSYMGFATAVAGLALGVASGNVAPALLGFTHGSSKPSVEHSGAFSGNSGAMGIKKPYLVIMRPQTAMPQNYQHYSGIPSSSLISIGKGRGLIRVRECHVERITAATNEEKVMIEKALHDGILVS